MRALIIRLWEEIRVIPVQFDTLGGNMRYFQWQRIRESHTLAAVAFCGELRAKQRGGLCLCNLQDISPEFGQFWITVAQRSLFKWATGCFWDLFWIQMRCEHCLEIQEILPGNTPNSLSDFVFLWDFRCLIQFANSEELSARKIK